MTTFRVAMRRSSGNGYGTGSAPERALADEGEQRVVGTGIPVVRLPRGTTKLRTAAGEMEDVRLSDGTMPRLLGSPRVSTSRFLALLFAATVLFGCGGPDPPRPTILPPPPPSPPGAPQNLVVTDRGDGFIRWQWDPVSGAAGYQVQVSVGDDDFDPPDEQRVLPANHTAAEFRDPELAPGTVVHLRVRAFAGSAGSPAYGPFSPPVPGRTASSPATDRMALEAFFAATGGPDWDDNTAWLSSAPLSEWHGVFSDADGRVTALILDDNGLRGTIPPELGQLTELRALVLGDVEFFDLLPPGPFPRPPIPANRLDGTIPPALGELTNLEVLDLSSTGVSGTVPVELGQLPSLVRLDLAHNALSGPIPAELGGAANLVELDLGHNRLGGPIPAELGGAANLVELDLGHNRLSGPIPAALGQLANLVFLSLAGNASLSGPIPEELTNLTVLEVVFLPEDVCVPWGSPFDSWMDGIPGFRHWRCPPAETPSHLRAADRAALEALFRATGGDNWESNGGWLTTQPVEQWFGVETAAHGRVARLDLSQNGLNGRIPSELGQLASLEYLDLGGNELSGPIPAALGGLANLESLNLGGNRWSGPIPAVFGKLPNLKSLRLGGSAWSGPIPPELGGAANLVELDLGINRLSGSIPPELGRLTSLTYLGLAGNDLTGAIPRELGRLENLRLLILTENRLTGAIPGDLGQLANLTNLDLSHNRLNGTIPRELGQLRSLEYLHLGSNELVGPIPAELGNLANLGSLLVWGNQLNGTLPPALGRLSELRVLYLFDNPLRGAIPDAFLALGLRALFIEDTDVCAPATAAFSSWLARIQFKRPDPIPTCAP